MFELSILRGPSGVGENFPLREGQTYLLGRAQDCHILLPGTGISKHHCRITVLSRSEAVIEDMNSSNGTFLNGVMVRKGKIKSGDTLRISQFSLAFKKTAPDAQALSMAPSQMNSGGFETQDVPMSSQANLNISIGSDSKPSWMESNLYPIFDSLADRYDVRILLLIFFATWGVAIVSLSIIPFAHKANEKVLAESVEVAKLYARQLARINQQAIIDDQNENLVISLDERKLQTRGIVSAYVLDSKNGRILAPREKLGQEITFREGLRATQASGELVQVGENDIAYVSVPVRVISAEGQIANLATILVVYQFASGQFDLNEILEQVLNSAILAAILSLIVIVAGYRFLEGSIKRAVEFMEHSLRKSDFTAKFSVRWPSLAALIDQMLVAFSRSGAPSQDNFSSGSSDWMEQVVRTSLTPAAAFSTALQVLAWNAHMGQMTGINAQIAMGADLAQASRDVAFESTVRELCNRSQSFGPWGESEGEVEMSGRRYRMKVVFTGDTFLVNCLKEEG